ncbi:MAG: hypothetical protein Hyperionvirus17_27 [Hyperionvirus sp.]|uniref:Uncharacterized protein n=1 Tax=Hyperionvirus sp. TaxID=2487770 RepID=A0A3G5AA23_9VIRU|nr:MAG: hypothetical protein Hyperionvirus17_27 [Hyperionvirus sp.]
MSRISRYQESIQRFIINKSSVNDLEKSVKDNIFEIVNEFDHVVSIMLLTVIKNQGNKNNLTLNGYYMASGIEMMMLIATLQDREKRYNKRYSAEKRMNMIYELVGQINVSLSMNIDSLQSHFGAAGGKEKILKVFHKCVKLVNGKLVKLLVVDAYELGGKIKTTDLVNYHFGDLEKVKQRLVLLSQVKEGSFMGGMNNKYGSVCQLAVVLGWILGGGDDKSISSLEKVGTYLANIIKLTNDFINLEQDILDAELYSKNYIINYGFQNAFEFFVESKEKFIEACIVLDIYTNTVKEIVDLLENKVDSVIDKSSPDMKSHYTLESNLLGKLKSPMDILL